MVALEVPDNCTAAVTTPAAAAATVMVTPTADDDDPGSIPNGPVGIAAVALAFTPVAHDETAFCDAAMAI
jgi:hypothetical protein